MLFDTPNTIIRPHKKLCQKKRSKEFIFAWILGTENKPENRLKPTYKK